MNNKKTSPSRVLTKREEENLFSSPSLFFKKLSIQDKEFFVKRLAYLLKAGIPLLESLAMLKEQTSSKFQKKIIDSLMVDINNGQPINIALRSFRKIFGDFVINVIKVGEETGFLHQNLDYLAEELKKRRILRKKIIGALIYPAVVAFATIGVAVFLVVFTFPRILPVFISFGVDIPITTEILIIVSLFLEKNGIYFLLGLIIFGLAIFFILKIKKAQIFIDRIFPSFPVFGQLIQNYDLTNICRTLGILLKGNLPLIETIKMTAETTNNLLYKGLLEDMAENILKGKKISVQFGKHPRFFPILIPQMLTVGEATGNLSGSLLYLAEFYESEVDEMTKNLSEILEPLLMILMGVIVGFVVLSIIAPIYGAVRTLSI